MEKTNREKTITHWSERLAREVIEKKNPPYVVSSGMTTSGHAHIGTVCEFLFPFAIKRKIEEISGKKAKFYFVGDILDAFDSIPLALKEYEEFLKPHLGKPLCHVPFPNSELSYGEYFLEEVKEIIGEMIGIENVEIVKINEVYERGDFDKYAVIYLENIEKTREVIEKSSGRKLPKDWSPIMPICENCGKIATTTVKKVDLEEGVYEYECSRDVGYTKGCGYKGKAYLKDHNWKLQWRLHWPAWQDYFGTSIEGGGVDHFTKGGSRDTLVLVFKEIFKKEPSLGFKYGFVLMRGKKYSKSKSSGMPVIEMIKLIPPKVLAYYLLKFDLMQNIDFIPEKENILRIINDYEETAALKDKENLTRAEKKRWVAYSIVGGKNWKGNFRDYLMYYQIYKDWEKVEKHLGVPHKDIEEIKKYVEKWIEKGFVPEDYNFSYKPEKAEGIVREFLCSLKEGMEAIEIHNAVYEFAKEKGIAPKELFRLCYETLIGKERGPRLGKLIYALGVKKVKEDVC